MEWTNRKIHAEGEPADTADIIIVDDDPDCLQVLEAHLTMEGFNVTCASNGEEALELLKSGQFWLMLTDYNMPGLDGLKLSEEALKAVPGLTILMLTGNPLMQLKHKATKLGITAVLAKPYDFNKLLGIVHMEDIRRNARPGPSALPRHSNIL
jgi:two-component system response regulator GlrR